MIITRPFDINSINDYKFATKYHATVVINRPDTKLFDSGVYAAIKDKIFIPEIVSKEGGYELYIGDSFFPRMYKAEELYDSKAEMYISINECMLDDICNYFAAELPELYNKFENAEYKDEKLAAFLGIHDILNTIKEMTDIVAQTL